VIFVDSNIPMYLVGADHPNKVLSQRLLERAIASRERLVTDAEVFQEILHRYTAIRRADAIGAAFDALLHVVDDVHDVGLEDVVAARHNLAAFPGLSARDALHVALMDRHGVKRVLSLDAGFDVVDHIERVFE